MNGKIYSLNINKFKKVAKIPVDEAEFIEGEGVKTDAHSGPDAGDRQVSLLAVESIRKQKECAKVKKKDFSLSPGDFAENITTEGIDLSKLKIGDILEVGDEVVLRISKIGKQCHTFCAIYKRLGDCIMPREGVFAEVVEGGTVRKGQELVVSG